jgi:hypothetical protein
MTQAGTAPTLKVKKLKIAPLCSLEKAKDRFEGKYLGASHVRLRLTESAQVATPEGETKFLFLKNVLPPEIVASAWRTLRKLRFSPAKNSRRKALKTSAGGELLFGWMLFPVQEKGGGIAPMLTADTREQWPEFRALWPLFWFIQYWFNKQLPKIAKVQKAKAESAKESRLDYLFRTCFQDTEDTEYWPSKAEYRKTLEQLEKQNPKEFERFFLETFAHFNPEYFEQVCEAAQGGASVLPGRNQGEAMTGYTVPGTMFSTITVNQSALFRSHADGNNFPGSLACLAAFGDFAGGELCFPRFGISCPIEPGDLLIGDNNLEQHGNIGPLSGERISIVAYMRNEFAK